MASEQITHCPAVFFDGLSARRHEVTAELKQGRIFISGYQAETLEWTFGGLIMHSSHQAGGKITLAHDAMPDARLEIGDVDFQKSLFALVPFLTRKAGFGRALKFSLVAGMIIIALLAGIYLYLPKASQVLAHYVPDSWRIKTGEVIVTHLTRKTGLCKNDNALAALVHLKQELLRQSGTKEDISIRIWRSKMVNAFAAPGGRIIVTTGLLKDTTRPDELAGVLAHEIGHVIERHPTQQMIRIIGLMPVIGLIFGQSGGFSEQLGEVGLILLLLRYSRTAEREADVHGLDLMAQAKIDPGGLVRFFSRRLKKSGDIKGFMSFLSTHPELQERIKMLKAKPQRDDYKQIISDDEWQTLKAACK